MDIVNIEKNLKQKVFSLKANLNPKLTSTVWETIYCIYDDQDQIITDYLACTLCNKVLKLPKDKSTKNLNTHVKSCPSRKNADDKIYQTTIGT